MQPAADRKKPQKTEQQYRNDIIRKMKALGVYHAEFAHFINAFARTLYDYDKTLASFEESGGKVVVKYTNKAGATNAVKNPFYLALENLRTDILLYSRELGLTPSGLKKINEASMKPVRKSTLAEALKALSG